MLHAITAISRKVIPIKHTYTFMCYEMNVIPGIHNKAIEFYLKRLIKLKYDF